MIRIVLALSLALGLVVLAGCGSSSGPANPPPPQPTAGQTQNTSPQNAQKKEDKHEHKPGQFGGIIVEIGRDNYHAEAVFEKNGVVRLYTLGQEEARIIEVEAKPLAAFVKPEGGTESVEFKFEPDPRDGDTPGKTSRFTATLPRELWGKRVEVVIPTMWINRERFRVGFKSSPAGHAEVSMPPPVVGEKEKQLFLTPGGKYTQADIQANRGQVPSQKFRDFVAEHDDNPKPGDWICPVTSTKANPECAWVVDGQTYYFCCPPCVTDWVKTAKTKPEKIRKASEYRKASEGK